MPDVAAPAAPLPRIPLWFKVALALLTATIVVLSVIRADATTLRGDEVVTRFWLREKYTVSTLISGGAGGQVSPATLYYLIARSIDAAKAPLNYLGLRPFGYFRLSSILFTAALSLASACLLAQALRRQESAASPIAYLLILTAVAVYQLQPKMFTFTGLDRPYSLWNGLWLLSLAWMLSRPDSKGGFVVLLTVLASTATAACFQILAIGIGFSVARYREGRSFKAILREGVLLFAAPALVGAYYALQSEPGDSSQGYPRLADQARFWLITNAHVWVVVLLTSGLVFVRPALRKHTMPTVALGALLLLVPLMAALARSRGYTTPSRQYLWTTTAIPYAGFLAALGWSDVGRWKHSAKLIVVAATALVVGFSVATFLRAPARNDSRALTFLDRGSPLSAMLRTERPTILAINTSLKDIEFLNLKLIAEWISVRYRSLPKTPAVVYIRDDDGSLIVDRIDRTIPDVTEGIGVRIDP